MSEINDCFKKTDLYCPNCGIQKIWLRENGGDYYQGETYYCTSCCCEHYLDFTGSEPNSYSQDIIEFLRNKET